jgi:hypothetical protein
MIMRTIFKTILVASLAWMAGCSKENDDVVEPLSSSAFPQVIRMDDEGGGDLEDEDKFSFEITLNDRVDPDGEELGGKVVPLDSDVTVAFAVKDLEGFTRIADYIKDVSAFYEVDDCNEADVPVTFDVNTGTGTVVFPRGVEAVEVEFEVDEDFFDDGVLNTTERSLVVALTGITPAGTAVTFNPAIEFKYEVLDKDGIHGDWELDPSDATQFAAFKALFGLINEDIRDLNANDVDKIEISIEYDEVKVVVELKETETITECGQTEVVNKVIEIEAELDDLDTLTDEGEIAFVGEIEQDDTTIKEFEYSGAFEITGSTLRLELEGEYDDEETGKQTLILEK